MGAVTMGSRHVAVFVAGSMLATHMQGCHNKASTQTTTTNLASK